MRYETSSHQGFLKMPTTTVHQLLDNKLIIFLRSWGSQDYDQKFIDEVMHFLSTVQADIEVTSPFDYVENLTSLANKVRISVLLAHDYFYKVENKTSYAVGFEAAILMRSKNEIAWSAVGRFDLFKISSHGVQMLSAAGTDRDSQTLLPVDLIGVERDIEVRGGSLSFTENPLIVSSMYQNSLVFKKDGVDSWSTELMNDDGTYWFSKIKSE